MRHWYLSLCMGGVWSADQCPPPAPILSQIDPVHVPTSHFLKIHFNNIFQSKITLNQVQSSSYVLLPKQKLKQACSCHVVIAINERPYLAC